MTREKKALRAGTEPQIIAMLISRPDQIAISTPVTNWSSLAAGDIQPIISCSKAATS